MDADKNEIWEQQSLDVENAFRVIVRKGAAWRIDEGINALEIRIPSDPTSCLFIAIHDVPTHLQDDPRKFAHEALKRFTDGIPKKTDRCVVHVSEADHGDHVAVQAFVVDGPARSWLIRAIVSSRRDELAMLQWNGDTIADTRAEVLLTMTSFRFWYEPKH